MVPPIQQPKAPLVDRKSLVDSSGRPLPPRFAWGERLHTISSKSKLIVFSLLATVTAAATLLANLDTIRNHLHRPVPVSVPLITVKLKNDFNKDVYVAARGDFILWLPGPDGYHTMGKYEFRLPSGEALNSEQITVAPNTTSTVYAKIMDQQNYSRILERADCDISLGVQGSEGGLRFSDNLPFTREGIAKHYILVNVGANH